MRRSILERILPLPFVDDWRTRADDCLIFGASLAGAGSIISPARWRSYRVHESNRYCRRKPDTLALYRRRLAINRLFEHLERKFSYNVARLGDFHHREFCTIGRPTFREFRKYLRVCMASRFARAPVRLHTGDDAALGALEDARRRSDRTGCGRKRQ